MRLRTVSGLVMLGLLWWSGPLTAQTPPPAQEAAPEPDPRQVLQKMCDFLKSQPQFTFKAEVTDDQVYHGGKKLQYGLDMEFLLRRPDHLRVNAGGDLVNKQFYYDGQNLTLYDQEHNLYGVMAAPADIDGALEKADQEYGLRVALADLASPNLCDLINCRVKHALYVGLHKVRGVVCHHLSFDSGGAQLQVWVEKGPQPLIRKVVLTHKEQAGSPQWTAYLSDWNFSPRLADDLFVFSPPQGAEKIEFLPVKGAQAPKGEPEKKKGGQK